MNAAHVHLIQCSTNIAGYNNHVWLNIRMYTAHVRGLTLTRTKCPTHGIGTVPCKEELT